MVYQVESSGLAIPDHLDNDDNDDDDDDGGGCTSSCSQGTHIEYQTTSRFQSPRGKESFATQDTA